MSSHPLAGGAEVSAPPAPRSVGIVIVSHSATLAAGVVELAREMAGPGVRIAAVGGLPLPDNPLGTDAASIKQAIERVYSDDGVLVLMDLGSALLSAELAVELLPPEWRDRVALCDAPLVEGAVAAAVQARLGSPVDRVLADARAALGPKIEHLQASTSTSTSPSEAVRDRAASPPNDEPTRSSGQTRELRFVVRNRLGIHARPAAQLVQTAARFESDVHLTNLTTGRPSANAKSMTQLSTLEALAGHVILVTATGRDADTAIEAIRALAESGFGEPDSVGSTEVVLPGSRGLVRSPRPSVVPETQTVGEAPGHGVRASGVELRGLAASPGIAHGKAHHVTVTTPRIRARPAVDATSEWQRLADALETVRARLRSESDALAQRGDGDSAAIIQAQALLLDDPSLVDPAHRLIVDEHVDAATAWQRAIDAVVGQYRSLHEEYLSARAADVADIGRQVRAALDGDESSPLALDEPCILIASDLGPADLSRLDRSLVLGICIALGGPTSHAAILARSLGIPTVVGLGPDLLAIDEGTPLIVDGNSGRVLLNPGPGVLSGPVGTASSIAVSATASPVERALPAVTCDGHQVLILANVGTLSDARAAVAAGAEGVGLFRTEFLFLNRQAAPDEAEQVAAYAAVAEALAGQALVIRTLDAGGDKPLPYLDVLAEANPFMGQRAIRLCLAMPQLFATQLRAIIRVAATHPVKVMFPMIATTDELRAAFDLLAQARSEVDRSGQAVPTTIEVGIMVETPAAALQVDRFCDAVEFFSIGTNDLAQYTAAADRGNARVASLADPFHPALLRLIRQVVDAAHARGKPVAVCGEMAGDPLGAALLIGLDVDELSMSPRAIPHIRQAIRALDYRSARTVAHEALDRANASEVRKLIADGVRSIQPPEAR